MQTSVKKPFELPSRVGPEARVWIYQANRNFSTREVQALHQAASAFAKSWQAHGVNLIADYAILFDRFLCLFVDESHHGASGCSIDSSVRFVQQVEREFGVSLLERTQVAVLKDNTLESFHFQEMGQRHADGEIDGETLVFNNLVATKKEMEAHWIVPIRESWHAKMLG